MELLEALVPWAAFAGLGLSIINTWRAWGTDSRDTQRALRGEIEEQVTLLRSAVGDVLTNAQNPEDDFHSSEARQLNTKIREYMPVVTNKSLRRNLLELSMASGVLVMVAGQLHRSYRHLDKIDRDSSASAVTRSTANAAVTKARSDLDHRAREFERARTTTVRDLHRLKRRRG